MELTRLPGWTADFPEKRRLRGLAAQVSPCLWTLAGLCLLAILTLALLSPAPLDAAPASTAGRFDRKIAAVTSEILPRLIEIRRDIHAHPELGFQEKRTAGIVADYFRRLGLEVVRGQLLPDLLDRRHVLGPPVLNSNQRIAVSAIDQALGVVDLDEQRVAQLAVFKAENDGHETATRPGEEGLRVHPAEIAAVIPARI